MVVAPALQHSPDGIRSEGGHSLFSAVNPGCLIANTSDGIYSAPVLWRRSVLPMEGNRNDRIQPPIEAKYPILTASVNPCKPKSKPDAAEGAILGRTHGVVVVTDGTIELMVRPSMRF
jgi:hypothetical protein